MGPGPYDVRLGAARARLFGEQVISGIREIWVRDVYLNRGILSIAPDATVVDLGANAGNFTMLALAHGSGVRCVSVEADPRPPATKILPGTATAARSLNARGKRPAARTLP